MRLLGVVLGLLLSIFGAQARVAGVPTSAGSVVQTCPNPTADSSIITAPTSCTLVNSLGTWSFNSVPTLGSNYAILLNGVGIEYNADGEAYLVPSDGVIGMTGTQLELNQSGRIFVNFNASTGCASNSGYTIPSGNSLWYAEVSGILGTGRPWFTQIGSPTATVVAAPFTSSGGNGATLMDAFRNTPTNGTVGIPAMPSGVPFYISGGGSNGAYSLAGTTTTAAAGAKVFCSFWVSTSASGFKGVFDFSGDNSTLIGDASQPLQIGYNGGIPNAGPHYAINLDNAFTNAAAFTGTNLYLIASDDCIHGTAGGPINLTNVQIQECGLGGGTGFGFNQNLYIASCCEKFDNHLSELHWSGGYNINVHGDGFRSNGQVFKDRTQLSTYTDGILGGNLAVVSGGGIGTQAMRWGWVFDCGGVHTVDHFVGEIPSKNPHKGTALIEVCSEFIHRTRHSGNCEIQPIGGDVLSGQQNEVQNISFNPAVYGINTTTSQIGQNVGGTITWYSVTGISGSGSNWTITLGTSTLAVGTAQGFYTWGDQVITGTIGSGANVITSIAPFDPTQGRFSAGQGVTATCLPANTTVLSYTSTTITLSQNETGSVCTSFQFTIVTSVDAGNMLLINDACTTPGLSEPALGFGQGLFPILIHDSAIINCAGTLQVGDASVNNGDSLATICTTHGNVCYADRAAALTAGVLIANDVDQWGNVCTVPNCPWPYLPPHPVENFSPGGTRFVDKLIPMEPVSAALRLPANDNLRVASNDNWQSKVLVALRAP